MINKTHYEGYSFALLELANENNKTQVFKMQAEILINVFQQEPTYLKLLGSYDIDFEVKEKLLNDVFKNKLDTVIHRMLLILIKKNKINSIVNILNLYINEINRIDKTYKGIIYSSDKLTSKEVLAIEEKTAKQLKHEVSLRNVIDKAIIAGFKIIINDIVIDATIINQLKMMKQEIIKNDN
jgi:F-type H+-transporting ATPase subunit delta